MHGWWRSPPSWRVLLVGIVLAASVAARIGTDLTPGASWLAGQLDGLAAWWAERSILEKVLIGGGWATRS